MVAAWIRRARASYEEDTRLCRELACCVKESFRTWKRVLEYVTDVDDEC
jgi:hypothetical protein